MINTEQLNLYKTDYPLYRDPDGVIYGAISALLVPNGKDEDGPIYNNIYVLIDTEGNIVCYKDIDNSIHPYTSEEDLMAGALLESDDPGNIMQATGKYLHLLVPPLHWYLYDRSEGIWLDPLTAAGEVLDKAKEAYQDLLDEEEREGYSQ